MKLAAYIETGATQVMLVAENDAERAAIKALLPEGSQFRVVYGQPFTRRQGGYWKEEYEQTAAMLVPFTEKAV